MEEVNVQSPDWVGTSRNQSRSPGTSICPLIGVARLDQEQYDEVDDPQSSTAPAPGWVTVTVQLAVGLPDEVLKVTEPVRAEVLVLACAVIVTATLPVPDDGDTPSQFEYEDRYQDVFDVSDV